MADSDSCTGLSQNHDSFASISTMQRRTKHSFFFADVTMLRRHGIANRCGFHVLSLIVSTEVKLVLSCLKKRLTLLVH